MKPVYKQLALVFGASTLLVVMLIAWYSFAHQQNTAERTLAETPTPLTPKEQQVTNPTDINPMNPTAIVKTNYGTFELELFTDTMPVTAGNFVKLANEGYFNGTKFHRVIDGFMIQGGDPLTKDDTQSARWGTGGPGYTIADEHRSGPLLSNTRGTIAMANSGPNSGGSQFFINVADNTFLDFDKEPLTSKHPVFGRVIAGMEVVDTIAEVETTAGDRPVEPVVIESVTINN